MAGMLIIVPLVVTVWVIIWIGRMLGGMGYDLLNSLRLIDKFDDSYKPYAGVVGILAVVDCRVSRRPACKLLDVQQDFRNHGSRAQFPVPGIKTIYESVRDLLKLFGGDSSKMGHVVLYTTPNTGQKQLGIVTNEKPIGLAEGDSRVIVYLPMGYMIGGPCVYARPEDIEPIDIPVETALKLAATAFIATSYDPKKHDSEVNSAFCCTEK